jgi:ABC-type hemin transport system substrate-binding protein
MARIAAAEDKLEELAGVLEDEDSSEAARADAEQAIDALEREIAALRDKPVILDTALKSSLGTFLLLDGRGVPTLDSVLYAELAAVFAVGS